MEFSKKLLNKILLDGLTKQQTAAVISNGGSLILSAGAGSGKTSVLASRAVYKIADPENGCDADKLLIITFSKAASLETRIRINKLFNKLIAQFPNDKRLVRQQILLQKAQICTIDSFCQNLIRENFSLLDISPNFKTAGTAELEQIYTKAADDVFESYYMQNDKRFLELVNYFANQDDTILIKIIRDIYETIRTNPFSRSKLHELTENYCTNNIDLKQSNYGRFLLDETKTALNFAVYLIETAILKAKQDELAWECYGKGLSANKQLLDELAIVIKSENYDVIYDKITNFKFATIGKAKKGLDKQTKEQVKTLHDTSKDIIQKKICEKLIICSGEEFCDDIEFLRPKINMLCELTEKFWNRADELKSEENLLDFADISQLALNLLVKQTKQPSETAPSQHEFPEAAINKKVQKTAFAKTISLRYDEIMLDEYQDTNYLQDLIFLALSKDEKNLFMVGDVKQCIYEFRHARTDIFLEKFHRFQAYDGENYPAHIILPQNFRSNKEVCGSINYIFSQICGSYIGDIEYDKTQELITGHPQEILNPADSTEFHIINYNDRKEDENDIILDFHKKTELEAFHVAKQIRKMLDTPYIIKDSKNGEERPCRPGDFAILLRSYKGKSIIFTDALNRAGVKASSKSTAAYFSSREISLMLNLLRIIDNPINDIALTAVLLSEIGGFSADDLTQIRLKIKTDSIYRCLLTSAQDGNKISKEFLSLLSALREYSAKNRLEKLISHIYDITLLPALSNSEQGQANLRLLLTYARNYEKNGQRGLTGFLQFIERTIRSKSDFEAANVLGETLDAVVVMSVHNSKGLEFPVVFVSDCHHDFYFGKKGPKYQINNDMGLSLKCIKPDEFLEYSNIPYKTTERYLKNRQLSEEMRILYVAATRAKQKLIFTGVVKDIEKKVQKITTAVNQNIKIQPYLTANAKNYLEWLILALCRHPSCYNIHKKMFSPQILSPSEISENCECDIICNIYQSEILVDEMIMQTSDNNVDDFVGTVALDRPQILKTVALDHPQTQKTPCLHPKTDERGRLSLQKLNNPPQNNETQQDNDVNYKNLYEKLCKQIEYSYPYPERDYLAKLSVSEIVKTNKISDDSEDYLTSRPVFMKQKTLTAIERGQALHSFMQYADFKAAIHNLEDEIKRLVDLKFIEPVSASSLNRTLIKKFLTSDLTAKMIMSDKILREFPFIVKMPYQEIISYINFPQALKNPDKTPDNSTPISTEIIVQGVVDCIFWTDNKIVTVDYKTDRVKTSDELMQKYKEQILLYKKALQKIFETDNIESYIYSLYLAKQITDNK